MSEEEDKITIVDVDLKEGKVAEADGSSFADLLGSLVKLGNAVLDRMTPEDREQLTKNVLKAFDLGDNKDESE